MMTVTERKGEDIHVCSSSYSKTYDEGISTNVQFNGERHKVHEYNCFKGMSASTYNPSVSFAGKK